MTKNIWKKILIFSLTATLVAGVVGCGGSNSASNSSKQPTDVPDYSDSDKELNIYAHRATSSGQFTTTTGDIIYLEDCRTVEHIQKYKDCGFNVLYPQENPYAGEEWETCWTKKYMDMAQEVGIKCMIVDTRIRDLSQSKEPLVGEGKQFATIEALAKELEAYMAPYHDHPAFFGVVMKDEPDYSMFEAMGQVIKALKMVDDEMYIKTCLLPYSTGVKNVRYTGEEVGETTFASYLTYLDKYFEESDSKYFGYDQYPFTPNGFMSTYLSSMQKTVLKAQEYDADVELVVQSFEMDSKRLPSLSDLYMQNNAAMAFGIKNIGYFTYWRVKSSSKETHTGAILDYDGTEMIYDEVQEVIAYTREMASVVLNFDYQKAYITYDSENDITAPLYFTGIKSEELDHVKVKQVTHPTLVTQMYDENQERNGYMVVNVKNTQNDYKETGEIILNVEGYDFVTYYSKDEPKTVQLVDGEVTLELEEGQAAFVIPHN